MNQAVRRKADKRNRDKGVCKGFTIGDLASPVVWLCVCAEIDSLAELKVVQYVMYHTSSQDYEPVELTIEEIANGRKYDDDTDERIDFGTGLSESGVRNGMELAITHGFLTCTIDDSNKSRVRKFYQMHMQECAQSLDPTQEVEVQTLYPQSSEVYFVDPASIEPEEVLEPLCEPAEQPPHNLGVQKVHPLRKNSKYIYNNNNSNIFRNKAFWLNKTMEDLSRDLGDHVHTASNIGQARRLYASSGLDPDAFQELLREAKDLARKASIKKVNSKGWANRMPYFFKCLRGMIKPNMTEIAS